MPARLVFEFRVAETMEDFGIHDVLTVQRGVEVEDGVGDEHARGGVRIRAELG
jgi:hypothetical protein